MRVERNSEDGLHGATWEFLEGGGGYNAGLAIRCTEYAVTGRASKRHKMRVLKKWSWHDERRYNSQIPRADVPLPPDVVKEALAAFPVTLYLGADKMDSDRLTQRNIRITMEAKEAASK